MPIYDNKLLYIHIPKTGGTSIEKYFEKKYEDKKLNIWTDSRWEPHLTVKQINNLYSQYNIENMDWIVSVRNPYDRMISALFYQKKLDKFRYPILNKNIVEFEIIQYIHGDNPCNFKIPQYEFIINHNNLIKDNIKIIKCENLTEDMKKLGYDDFDIHENKNKTYHNKYTELLTDKAIWYINKYYEKDFDFFGYEKIKTKEYSYDFTLYYILIIFLSVIFICCIFYVQLSGITNM